MGSSGALPPLDPNPMVRPVCIRVGPRDPRYPEHYRTVTISLGTVIYEGNLGQLPANVRDQQPRHNIQLVFQGELIIATVDHLGKRYHGNVDPQVLIPARGWVMAPAGHEAHSLIGQIKHDTDWATLPLPERCRSAIAAAARHQCMEQPGAFLSAEAAWRLLAPTLMSAEPYEIAYARLIFTRTWFDLMEQCFGTKPSFYHPLRKQYV